MCTDQLLFPGMVAMVLVSGWLVLLHLKVSGLDISDSWGWDCLLHYPSLANCIPWVWPFAWFLRTLGVTRVVVIVSPSVFGWGLTSDIHWQWDCRPEWGAAWHSSIFYMALAAGGDGWGIHWGWTFWASGILHLVLLLCKGGLNMFVLCCHWCVPLSLQWIFPSCKKFCW